MEIIDTDTPLKLPYGVRDKVGNLVEAIQSENVSEKATVTVHKEHMYEDRVQYELDRKNSILSSVPEDNEEGFIADIRSNV